MWLITLEHILKEKWVNATDFKDDWEDDRPEVTKFLSKDFFRDFTKICYRSVFCTEYCFFLALPSIP